MTADRGAEDQQVAADTFEIYLAWSDTTLTVRLGQTALQALTEAGVAVEPGCQTGGCGMCVTAYVEGDIIHKDGSQRLRSRALLLPVRLARKDAHRPGPVNGSRLSTKGSTVRRKKKRRSPPQAGSQTS